MNRVAHLFVILAVAALAAFVWPTATPTALAQDAPAPAEAPAEPTAEPVELDPPPTEAPAEAEADEQPEAETDAAVGSESSATMEDWFNAILGNINTGLATVLFFDVSFGITPGGFPFLVAVLMLGAIFFTFSNGWINFRGFKHALQLVTGKYSNPDDPGELTPFRALTSALSATVGLGNIAGVAIAVKTGGPGAIFWMMTLALFGMSAKFHESTLAQMFRVRNPDGSISGGPMFYLDRGLKQQGLGPLGKVLAVIFAVFCMGASFGGGNMFQSNQAAESFYATFVRTPALAERERDSVDPEALRPLLEENQLMAAAPGRENLEAVRAELSAEQVRDLASVAQIETQLPADEVEADHTERRAQKQTVSAGIGILMAGLVAVVIIGGIGRIGATTSRIVPAMCALYVTGCVIVILFNLHQVPSHVALVFTEAFAWDSAYGGVLGVMVIGFTRAAFSSEAGLGSSAIAHSAAKASHPVREGLVASLEPFIDTIVICFMTAMVVLITDAYKNPLLAEDGAAITLHAFKQTRLGDFFPYLLSLSIVLFAFSTMISWAYYGERAWGYLFGIRTLVIYRVLFVICVFIGAVASLSPVILFADLMLLSMAFPNVIGGVILAGVVRRSLRDYWQRHKAGDDEHIETTAPSYEI